MKMLLMLAHNIFNFNLELIEKEKDFVKTSDATVSGEPGAHGQDDPCW